MHPLCRSCTILISLLMALQTATSQSPVRTYDISKVNEKKLSHHLQLCITNTMPCQFNYPVDLDGDGQSEMLTRQPCEETDNLPSAILIQEIYGESTLHQRTQIQKCLEGRLDYSLFVSDLTHDGRQEICFSTQRNDTITFQIMNLECQILAQYAVYNPHYSSRKWEGYIIPKAVVDLNGDGWEELLLTVHTTYAYQPRGVVAYDFKNRNVLWRHDVGFTVADIHIIDANSDGEPEFLLSNNSPDNAIDAVPERFRRVNGTTDANTYLYVLDSHGHCLHSRVVTGRDGNIKIRHGDTDNDGKPNYYALIYNRTEPYMARLNIQNLVLTPVFQLEERWVELLVFEDINCDGSDELILAWNDGLLEIRDAQLNISHHVQLKNFSPLQLKRVDLNNNGSPTLIVIGHSNGQPLMLCFDRHLELIALNRDRITGIHSQFPIFSFGYGEKKRLVLRGEGCTYFGHLKRQIALPFSVPWLWILGTAGLCMLFALLIVTYNNRRTHCLTQIISPVFHALDSGLCLIDGNRRLMEVNQTFSDYFKVNPSMLNGRSLQHVLSENKLEHLLPTLTSLLDDPPQSGKMELTLPYKDKIRHMLINVSSVSPRGNGNAPALQLLSFKDVSHVVESKRAVAWASMAQKLAHEIKTPLSTVRLSAQRLQALGGSRDQRQAKYLNHIITQVERMCELTDSLLKFARIEKPASTPENINTVIKEAMHSFPLLSGRSIQVNTSLAPNLPTVHIDRPQMHIALSNLISNALKAMGGKGILNIASRLVQHLEQPHHQNIQIEINDSGVGIDEEGMSRLFEPFFTQSPGGTGLGLAIVKKIIDDHQGSIVFNSEPGIGTTVTISLPLKTL